MLPEPSIPSDGQTYIGSLRRINPDSLRFTSSRLVQRIIERFPYSNLVRVSREVQSLTMEVEHRLEDFKKPLWWWRFLAALLLLAILLAITLFFTRLSGVSMSVLNISDLMQAIEAGINNVILLSAGAFFLFTLEARLRRKRVLRALHELRALAHIIDLHQLTKDPDRIAEPERDTPSSPTRTLSPFELGRYLDYCSELLALISKIAALYVQRFEDTELVRAVDEIEDLTTGLSQKIWQKIMIIENKR